MNTTVVKEEDGEIEYTDTKIEVEGTTCQSGFLWNTENTAVFIGEYEKDFEKFRDPKTKKKDLWRKIAERMCKIGHPVTAEMLDQKWRNLKSKYNKIKNNQKINNNDSTCRISWSHYGKMSEILQSDDVTVNFPVVISCTDTSSGTSRSNTPLEFPENLLQDMPRNRAKRKLGNFRKRQLEIEEERLEELKKIRKAVEEANQLSSRKIQLMERYLERCTY